MDRADLSATAALLGEMDGDLEFFHELFQDFPTDDDVGENAVASPPPSCLTVAVSSDRRRQRWLAFDGGSDLPMLSGWRDVAKTQKHARQAAEDENTRLRRLVVEHERAVQKMIKLMQKSVTTLASRSIVAPTAAIYSGPPVDLFQIMRSLDALTLRHGNLLPSGVAVSPKLQICGIQNQIVPSPTGDALESTVQMVWLLPFDVDAITSALVAHSIRLVTRKHVPNCTTVHESPDFKIVQAVTTAKEKNGVKITKQGQLATRREPPGSDGSQLVVMELKGGYYMDATCMSAIDGDSCIQVSRVLGHDSVALGPLSQIKWCRRFRVQPAASANKTSAERALWINAFTANSTRKTERHIDKLTQGIENLLLSSD